MKALLFLLLVIPEISVFAILDPSDMETYTTSRYGPPPAVATATRRPYNNSPYHPFIKYRPIPWLGDTGKDDPKCMKLFYQKWSECAIPCPATCDEPAPPSCRRKCKPGCECTPGTVLRRTGYCVPKSTCKWDFWRAIPDGYFYSDFERAGLEGPNDGLPRPEEESENKIEEKGEKKIKKIKKKIETKIEEKVEEMVEGKDEEKAADENNISENNNEKGTEQGENSQAEEENKNENEHND